MPKLKMLFFFRLANRHHLDQLLSIGILQLDSLATSRDSAETKKKT